jgi:fatty acid desaturase
MRQLMRRTNSRAARDTLLWLALLAASGYWAFRAWGSWWALPAFFVYGTLYGSASDSRWHEMGHGTAFRTQWLNSIVYRMASFMDLREAESWRWSHARHHSDTLIVGSDPEIAVPRPTSLFSMFLELFAIRSVWAEGKKLAANLAGRVTPEQADYIPESARRKAIWGGRVYVLILTGVVAWCIVIGSIEPALFIGLPSMYGRWLLVVYGYTQHTGLAEDVLDHRLNCRTVRMNPINRFLYSNMNFHIEHHMFPTVPYHALPALHEAVKDDMPPTYPSILAAYREIIPAVRRQGKDPSYFVARPLPGTTA